MKILKVISLLMSYPTQDLQQYAEELRSEINAAREIPPQSREELNRLLEALSRRDLMDVQEEYGMLFSRGRSLSLMLFEHVHGESRDRGQAMVDLMGRYQTHGFEMSVRELPDYIPLYLEYLSQRPHLEARQSLADVSHLLARLSARLQERQSLYHTLFDALLIISGERIDTKELRKVAAKEERDDTLEAMDAVWEEEQVTFMDNQQPNSGCSPNQGQAARQKQEQAEPVHWVPHKTPGTHSVNK